NFTFSGHKIPPSRFLYFCVLLEGIISFLAVVMVGYIYLFTGVKISKGE
ncbi:hypothetical protein GPL24_02790, partial [Anaerostipes hadrus]|nr:hypothetical protein [Anaerostipes hadrus]